MESTTKEKPKATKAPAKSRVGKVREALGLDKRAMAAKMGCSYASERRFEDNDTLPTTAAVMERLRTLAKKAGVELESK